jgi:neutral trehalase
LDCISTSNGGERKMKHKDRFTEDDILAKDNEKFKAKMTNYKTFGEAIKNGENPDEIEYDAETKTWKQSFKDRKELELKKELEQSYLRNRIMKEKLKEISKELNKIIYEK